MFRMKTLTIRVPDGLAAEIEAESRERHISKSDVVRERLQYRFSRPRPSASFEAIADLIGSVVDDLPADLSARKKHYLRAMRYGQKRPR
jgi:hypothetical protein